MQAVQKQVQAGPSAACRAVSYALQDLGMQHTCHILSPDGGQVANILLQQHKVALLVEGRGGYLVNTGQRRGVLAVAELPAAKLMSTGIVCR